MAGESGAFLSRLFESTRHSRLHINGGAVRVESPRLLHIILLHKSLFNSHIIDNTLQLRNPLLPFAFMGRRKQSSRKRQNVDRLSSLPDSIVCHILSFLPTKLSVATSILARRWRFLWMDVPNIHLDFQSPHKRYKGRPPISDIINKIFSGHNFKALGTFRLGYTISNANDKLTQGQLESWIAAVIARKVRNIELEFSDLIKMPECLFTCKSLVELRLYKCEISISFPASICFPSLEKLHICFVEYNNDETFQHLISGCSILEELRVIEGRGGGGGVVCSRISSPTLKWLAINFGFDGQDRMVEIITPALLYLQVRGCSSRCKILTQALSSLTEADIELVYTIVT